MATSSSVFDWDTLNLGPEEDPKDVEARVNSLYKQLLDEKGIAYRPEKNSPGLKPGPQQSREVAVMACLGLDPKDIALVLNIELKVLTLLYAKELKVTALMANAMVARTAFLMATSGRSPDMTKFWLKSQAGWKDQTHVDITSKGEKIDGESAKDKVAAALKAAGVSPEKAKSS